MRNSAPFACLLAALLPLTLLAADPAAPPPAPLKLRPLEMPKPQLSDEVCRQRLHGWVELDFAVLPDGSVADVKVVKSEPAGAFDAAATAAVAGRRYSQQEKPVKMHEKVIMSSSDCRAEQLRAGPVMTPGIALPAEECALIAAEARKSGERIDAAESGRAVLQGETAQAFSAPTEGCFTAGKVLKAGGKWTAYVEYRGFSLIAGPKDKEEAGIWVWSKQLKDTAPILPLTGAVPGTPAASLPTPPALPVPAVPVPRAPAASQGERLAYLVGCVNCHHQTPKEIINAPPLTVVQTYSAAEFRKLMKTGVTRAGRNLLAEASLMGIVATEQFSQFTDEELTAVYDFLRAGWTPARAAQEEARIPELYKGKAR